MILATKTKAAIDAAILKAQEEPHRAHLGASLLGEECARRVWYQWRWTKAEAHEPRMLRLFGDGHHMEPRVHAWLRAAGIEVFAAGQFAEKKEVAHYRIAALAGHFGGTCDGVVKNVPELGPDVPALLEIKTANEKGFKKFAESGVINAKWKYFVQMQCYMGLLGLEWTLFIVYGKNDADLHIELVKFDFHQFTRAMTRAQAIATEAEPPARAGKNPAAHVCKFCHLSRLCHFGDVRPDRNCRTCEFAEPLTADPDGEGEWFCRKHDRMISTAEQRLGCAKYNANPKLFTKS